MCVCLRVLVVSAERMHSINTTLGIAVGTTSLMGIIPTGGLPAASPPNARSSCSQRALAGDVERSQLAGDVHAGDVLGMRAGDVCQLGNPLVTCVGLRWGRREIAQI